jgi:flagellar motility protein MotE (MotC chaperone)
MESVTGIIMESPRQTYTLPRETFNLLLAAPGGQEKAEVFAKSMESFLVAIDNKATAEIVDKKEMIKIEIREQLRKELVTREIFDEKFNVFNERFNVVDEKFKSLEQRMGEKFKSLNFKLNLFLAIALAALTFANPTFVGLIEKLF